MKNCPCSRNFGVFFASSTPISVGKNLALQKMPQVKKQFHPRSLTARPWKMVVGRRSFPIGMVSFHGRAVKLRGGLSRTNPPDWRLHWRFLDILKATFQLLGARTLWDTLYKGPEGLPEYINQWWMTLVWGYDVAKWKLYPVFRIRNSYQ